MHVDIIPEAELPVFLRTSEYMDIQKVNMKLYQGSLLPRGPSLALK